MEKISNVFLGAGSAIVFGSFFLKSFFYTVDAGERAIIFDRLFGGLKEKIIGEGMHFYFPII